MDAIEIKRRRALYRATHRGTKELDLMLGRYAEHAIPAMSVSELDDFERFMALPEPDIEQWLRRGSAPEGVRPITERIRTFLGLSHPAL
jgi:antitoxin CptB